MQDQLDLYMVLGLSRNCSEEDLKSAFRKLALKDHPDKNPGDPAAGERFKSINHAYQVLIDPNRRRAYDLRNPNAGKTGQEEVRSRQWPPIENLAGRSPTAPSPLQDKSASRARERIYARTIAEVFATLGFGVALFVMLPGIVQLIEEEEIPWSSIHPRTYRARDSDRCRLRRRLSLIPGYRKSH